MSAVQARYQSLGALHDGATTTFRVWAPEHVSIELVVDGGIRLLTRDEHGYWHGRFADVRPGARYRFRIDGNPERTFPDPASRYQPDGVHGPSEVVDPFAFDWSDSEWTPPPLDRIVFYELHVGAFTPEGTFAGVVDRLPYLRDLGVTAIELMPVADFPGDRNWGYDGVALFAPARCYGRPDDLRALVDAAHAHGLAVFLDVVYNHLGPDGAYANVFSPHYFTSAHRSPWGDGVNLDAAHSREVRRFFIENALYWVNDFHLDGLRLDATHALRDESRPHFLAELTSIVRAYTARPVVLVAEDHRNLDSLVRPPAEGGLGFDAVWADDFHHQARVHTAHDREGYYADFTGTAADLAETIRHGWFFRGQQSRYLGHARGTDPALVEPRQCVICIQNHDQVGNRADGARLHHQIDLAAYRALSTLLLLAPQTPLLFMGQEWAATSPFLFFTDHHDELGRMVTAGRREEFSGFAAFADAAQRARIPDPQAAGTFHRSRLPWHENGSTPHESTLRLYRRLFALRREGAAWADRSRRSYDVGVLDDHTLALAYPEHGVLIVVRLSGGGGVVPVPHPGARVLLTTEDRDVADDPQPVVFTGETLQFGRPGGVVLGLHPSR